MSRLTERELGIPEGIVDEDGVDNTEIVRIWWQGNAPKMVIRPALREPRMVGAMLAELAFHFSRAFEDRAGYRQQDAMKQIMDGWTDAHAYAAEQKKDDGQ